MKKISCVLLCMMFLVGCILPAKTDKDTVLQDTQLITESVLPYEEKEKEKNTETHLSIKESISDLVKKDAGVLLGDEVKAEMMREQQDLFYFSSLEITQQNIYVEMLYAIENYVEEMQISTVDTEILDKVFQCVLMDHPEIFYVDGYSFVKYALKDVVKKITFTGSYLYNQEEKKEKEVQIEKAALDILKGISAEASDYEKVKYIYETIIDTTEYQLESEDNQNICSVFINHVSVCQGYAKAVQYLLNKLSVPTTLVVGSVSNGEGHAWNLVKCENEFYHLDATWGDASYQFHLEEELAPITEATAINYDYLCVTTEDIERTHNISEMFSIPFCEAKGANYYVREGAYFTEMNYNQLEQLIANSAEQGKESITMRCSDRQVYETIIEELIENQNIFYYINGENNSILYADSPKQLSITFWL